MILPEFQGPTDRFIVERRAGAGGMGDVYEAFDRELERTVALKVLRPQHSPLELRRFQREIAVIADLRHPNIVEYISHGTLGDGRLFYAMEWLDGEDLVGRVRQSPIGMKDAVEIIRRSAAAMAAVHARGIVHRDLKLGNIFLLRGRMNAIKLIDFGVVKLPDEPLPEERGSIIGTPHFMAPEQAQGEDVDARADVYSLGAALFRLLTGRHVFETEHIIALLGRLVIEDPPGPMTLRFDIPEALNDVVLQSISRRPEERFENGGEMARALARVGELNNDPPATDRSASAVRRAIPHFHSIQNEVETNRRNLSERRVVAAAVFKVPSGTLPSYVHAELLETLGPDARLEALLGGQLVAVLGVQSSLGDEALRAARAALLVTKAIPEASAVVSVGYAVTNSAGTNLAGEALERAGKQLEIAAAGAVRVDTSAIVPLGGRFVVAEDKDGAVLVREDASGYSARRLLGKSTPTVGRDKELALLTTVYQELLEEGTPRAALLTGAPGVGKSRVRADLLTRLETGAVPPEMLFVRGSPIAQSSSLSGFGRAIRAVIGVHDGESAIDQVEKVRAHLNFRLPKPLRFLSGFLGELVGVSFPDADDEPLRAARQNAQLMQSRMRMALEAFVRAQADLVPQIVFLEDAHWADGTTLDLIDWLLGCPDLRFAVFAFARTEIATRFTSLWANRNVTRFELPPLSRSASEKLVQKVLPEADARLKASIIERAGGNALFLEELLRQAAEGSDELPLTVQAVVQMRVDRLAPSVKEALRAASVIGPIFWTGGVSALSGRDAESDVLALEAAEIALRQPTSRIAGEIEWSFRQAVVRDAAYASIIEEERAVLHQECGTWLESHGDVDVGVLAKHAEAGNDLGRAAGLYARATLQAYANGAELQTTLDLAEAGLRCGAEAGVRGQLLLAASRAHVSLGRLEEGVRSAEQAAELVERGDLWAEAQVVAAAALIESGRAKDGDERARSALGTGMDLARPRVALMATRVRGLVDLGQQREALRIADEALALARELNDAQALLIAHDARLFALMQLADPAEVVLSGPQVIETAENVGDVLLATRARINTASSMNLLGLWDDARILLERALVDARERRMRILEAFALHNLGMCEARLGHFDRAIELEQEAAKNADATSAARLRIHARVYEAMFLLWRRESRPDLAASDLRAALQIAERVAKEVESVPALSPTSAFLSAAVALARARARDGGVTFDEATEIARTAVNMLATTPVEEWEELTHLILVDALLGASKEAKVEIDAAFKAVANHAQRISRAEYRAAYLGRVPEVVRIGDYARTRLKKVLPAVAGLQRLPSLRPPPRGPENEIPTVRPPSPNAEMETPSSKPPHAATTSRPPQVAPTPLPKVPPTTSAGAGAPKAPPARSPSAPAPPTTPPASSAEQISPSVSPDRETNPGDPPKSG